LRERVARGVRQVVGVRAERGLEPVPAGHVDGGGEADERGELSGGGGRGGERGGCSGGRDRGRCCGGGGGG
jgi:hypothetical protein